MARREADRQPAWAALAVVGVLATFALPSVRRTARRAAMAIGGMTFTSGVRGGPRPQADPAHGRAA
jgi:hypothetical protein